jgi:uncharacterized protein YbaR (Trm112 family)
VGVNWTASKSQAQPYYHARVISPELLEILACPKCHTKVEMKEPDKLRCPVCRVLYPIVDGIPVMLIEEGKPETE